MMKLFYTLVVAGALASLAFAAVPADVLAEPLNVNFSSNTTPNQQSANCGPTGAGEFKLCNPLGVDNFCDLVRSLLNVVLAIGLPIAVLFLVWAGFKFIIARGSEAGLIVAKKNFQYVIIGIAVFLGAWTFATVIATTVQGLDQSGTIKICR